MDGDLHEKGENLGWRWRFLKKPGRGVVRLCALLPSLYQYLPYA
jgi:hypothetical protein